MLLYDFDEKAMLRFLLQKLNPYKEGRSSYRGQGFWSDLRVSVYVGIMRLLKKHYRRYAYSDLIEIGDQGISVLQEHRDRGFELMLRKMGEDVSPRQSVTYSWPTAKHVRFEFHPFRWFFNFVTTLTLTVDGREYIVDHTRLVSVWGSVPGILRSSTSEDLLMRSSFRAELQRVTRTESETSKSSGSQKTDSSNSSYESLRPERGRPKEPAGGTRRDKGQSQGGNKKKRVRLNPGGEKIYEPTSSANEKPVVDAPVPSDRRHLQGMDVDESF